MTYCTAPAVFALEQGDTFNCDDTVFIANALADQESDAYLDAIDPLTLRSSRYTEGKFFGQGNIVEESPIFISLPDDTGYHIWHPADIRTLPHNRNDNYCLDRVKLERHQRLTFAARPPLTTKPFTTELEAEDQSSLMTL